MRRLHAGIVCAEEFLSVLRQAELILPCNASASSVAHPCKESPRQTTLLPYIPKDIIRRNNLKETPTSVPAAGMCQKRGIRPTYCKSWKGTTSKSGDLLAGAMFPRRPGQHFSTQGFPVTRNMHQAPSTRQTSALS